MLHCAVGQNVGLKFQLACAVDSVEFDREARGLPPMMTLKIVETAANGSCLLDTFSPFHGKRLNSARFPRAQRQSSSGLRLS
jgi:hypothetical protein